MEAPELSQTPVKSESASRDPTETPPKFASHCEESQGGAFGEWSPDEEALSDEIMESDDEDEDEALYDEFRQTPMPTPNRVRTQLRKLITDKGLKVKEIQALIGERPGPAWNKFMNGKYKDQSWAY